MYDRKKFGETLKKLRIEKGMSQADLANLINTNRSTLANYESGNRNPDNEILYNLSKTLNVSADYLLGISNVKELDTSIKAVRKCTKLSEEAVNSILGISLSCDHKYLEALDLTISSPKFTILIFSIRQWLNVMDLRQEAIRRFKEKIIEYEEIPPKDIMSYATKLSLSKESCLFCWACDVMKYQSELDYCEYTVLKFMKMLLDGLLKGAEDNGEHNPPKE